MIMFRQKIIILLIGLMCFGSVGGVLAVVCHGSDGHVAVEVAVHNHCECDGDGQDDEGARLSIRAVDEDCCGHDHCEDSLVSSKYVALRKNVKAAHRVFVSNLFLKSISEHTTALSGRRAERRSGHSSFFGHLETVIFLA